MVACLHLQSLESIADTFAEGELQHVHTLIVDDDHFHSPADDVLPSFDCGGLGGGASTRAASNGGVEGNVGARVWQAGEDQLLRQLQPYYSALAAEWQATLDDCDSQAGGSRNGSTVEGLQQLHQQTEGVRRNVRAIMDCFHGHVSSMLDTITLEVRRCHTKMGGLAANHSAAAAAATAAAGGVTHNHEELRFLRELAGTQVRSWDRHSARVAFAPFAEPVSSTTNHHAPPMSATADVCDALLQAGALIKTGCIRTTSGKHRGLDDSSCKLCSG
eukprot:COSAG01_NODE_2539_length_7485_cov_49.290650_10_plen_274_part_00